MVLVLGPFSLKRFVGRFGCVGVSDVFGTELRCQKG